MTFTHTTHPGGVVPRCDPEALGPVVPWEQVMDPDDPTPYTCGACWRDAAGGVEPMGGSLYLEAAHAEAGGDAT